MTPPQFDPDIVTARLRLLRDLLDELEGLHPTDTARLVAEPVTRAAVERFLQAIVDLAIDINSHIAVTVLQEAPRSGRSSFTAVAEAGAVASDLAERLAPAAGLRNILVHRYTDIDVEQVAAATEPVVEGFSDYIKQVAAFTSARLE